MSDKEWEQLNNEASEADKTNWEILMTTGSRTGGGVGGGGNRWERESLYQRFDPLVTPKPLIKIHCDPPPDFSFVSEPDGNGGCDYFDNSEVTVIQASSVSNSDGGNDGGQIIKMNCEPDILPLIPDISPPPPPTQKMSMNNNFEPEFLIPETPPLQTSTPRKYIPNQNQNSGASETPDWVSTFSRVLAEYEKTMSGYIQQIDVLKEKLEVSHEEKLAIIDERDVAFEDLRNVESAFSDVHGKYERSKGLLENYKKNEEILKKRDQEMTEKIAHRDTRIETLKEKLQTTLEQMHMNYEGRLKEMEIEASRQRIVLKKGNLKVETLQNDVEQKSREISKLSSLCDELMNGEV